MANKTIEGSCLCGAIRYLATGTPYECAESRDRG